MRIIESAAKVLMTIGVLLTIGVPASATEALRRDAEIIGDTLEIHDRRIRLDGIDAPEAAQLCLREGRKERCGQRSAFFLADLIGQGMVRCVSHDVDRYGRDIATCWLGDVNLNEKMVAAGQAVAYRKYSKRYVEAEGEAEAAARALVDPVRDALGLSAGALAKVRGRH